MPARVILLQFADAKISNWICVLPDHHDTDPDRFSSMDHRDRRYNRLLIVKFDGS
mgnify:CR=1 FL=1